MRSVVPTSWSSFDACARAYVPCKASVRTVFEWTTRVCELTRKCFCLRRELFKGRGNSLRDTVVFIKHNYRRVCVCTLRPRAFAVCKADDDDCDAQLHGM